MLAVEASRLMTDWLELNTDLTYAHFSFALSQAQAAIEESTWPVLAHSHATEQLPLQNEIFRLLDYFASTSTFIITRQATND